MTLYPEYRMTYSFQMATLLSLGENNTGIWVAW